MARLQTIAWFFSSLFQLQGSLATCFYLQKNIYTRAIACIVSISSSKVEVGNQVLYHPPVSTCRINSFTLGVQKPGTNEFHSIQFQMKHNLQESIGGSGCGSRKACALILIGKVPLRRSLRDVNAKSGLNMSNMWIGVCRTRKIKYFTSSSSPAFPSCVIFSQRPFSPMLTSFRFATSAQLKGSRIFRFGVGQIYARASQPKFYLG